MKRGLTLIEILVVIAIIALLAALLFPVFARSQAKGRETSCMNNLHQLYLAWKVYVDQHENGPLPGWRDFGSDPSVHPVLKCPSDEWGGVNSDATKDLGTPVSYFMAWTGPDYFVEPLKEADPNHAIFYCVLHGERTRDWNRRSMAYDASNAVNHTRGLVLRVLLDGSVQRAQVNHICSSGGGAAMRGRPAWTLVTDAPCPEPFCPAGHRPCE